MRKLQAVLDEIAIKTNIDLRKIPIFVVQMNDNYSLAAMAQKCQIVVNCCGPYGLYGEAVVKACIEAGTHHVDINTEPQYMEMIQLKYDEQAKENNVYVVSACGFPSMALDVGVNFIRNNFKGTLNFIDAYTEFCDKDTNLFDPVASAAVWASLVLALSNNKEILAIGNNLFKKLLSKLSPKPTIRGAFHKSEVVRGVCMPFPLIVPKAVETSQYHFYEQYNIRPIQFHNYLTFPSVIFASIFFVWCFLITFLARFRCTREFLIRHPSFFSFGLCSPKGPSEEKMENLFFRITFSAVGWSKVTENPDYTFLEPEDKSLVAKVSGLNPLYGTACVALLTSAVTILTERHKMPGRGGVFTPGAAFARTNIISDLEKEEHGMVFDITQE